MESLAAPRMALEELSDYWLNELIVFLMDCKCVLEVLRLMTVMRDDNRGLPYALREPNENGQMFYTEWLPLFFQSCHASRLNEGQPLFCIYLLNRSQHRLNDSAPLMQLERPSHPLSLCVEFRKPKLRIFE